MRASASVSVSASAADLSERGAFDVWMRKQLEAGLVIAEMRLRHVILSPNLFFRGRSGAETIAYAMGTYLEVAKEVLRPRKEALRSPAGEDLRPAVRDTINYIGGLFTRWEHDNPS